jgi:hypothetical protein
MICYLIQCHKDADQVAWLVSVLAEPGNVFVLSVDGPEAYFQQVSGMFAGREDVLVIRSQPVVWCGASQVVALLDGIRQAVGQFNWDFLINLSGQCFPLQPQSVIKQFLSDSVKRGQYLFISIFRPRQTVPIVSRGGSTVTSAIEMRLFQSKGTFCRIQADLTPYFRNWNVSPVMKPFLRPAMWMGEDTATRTLYLRPLYEYEARFRMAMLKQWPHYCGRTWFMSHRSFLEWVASSPRTDELFNLFSTVFEPDESFIQTLAMSEPKWAAGIVRKSYRLNEGRPESISDASRDSLINQESFFGRKMDFSKSTQLRKTIQKLTRPEARVQEI